MSPKKGSKDRDKTIDDKIAEVLKPLMAEEDDYRRAFRQVVGNLRMEPSIAKAEGLLQFWAEKRRHWGDHEAVAYLVSRGRDPLLFSRDIQAHWRSAEQSLLNNSASSKRISDGRDRFEFYSRFWNFDDSQELTIDGTMLRTVEWCKIRGFDQWWEKMGKEIKESSYSGGSHPLALFQYARADYAIRTMGDGLRVALDAAETMPSYRKDPWLPSRVETDMNLGCAVPTAASIVFAHKRLSKDRGSSDLINRGIDSLRNAFDHGIGAWPSYSGEADKMSIGATAMALHALRLSSNDDWDQFAVPARDWLLSQQHEDGYWREGGSPDPVWLTVLVLDALELCAGGSRLTFNLDTPMKEAPLVFVAYQHRDSRWLQELENHLGALIHAGKIEFFDDRKILAGKEWDPAVKAKLNSAKIIVPLISSNFLSSKYIQTIEFPTAIARHRDGSATVIPVLLDHCDWQSLEHRGFALSQLNFLPKDENNDLKPVSEWRSRRPVAFTQIAQRIRKCVEEISPMSIVPSAGD